MKDLKRRRANAQRAERGEPPGGMPPEVWNVIGFDKHGEPINYDEKSCYRALEQADRLNGLGGRVMVRRMVWSSPAAGYRLPRKEQT